MNEVKITIKTTSSAFGEEQTYELARILDEIKDYLTGDGITPSKGTKKFNDINGNKTAEVVIK